MCMTYNTEYCNVLDTCVLNMSEDSTTSATNSAAYTVIDAYKYCY